MVTETLTPKNIFENIKMALITIKDVIASIEAEVAFIEAKLMTLEVALAEHTQAGLPPPDSADPILSHSVSALKLTTRSAKCLMVERIYDIGQLIQCTETKLLKIPNLGLKSVREIKEALAILGQSAGVSLRFGTKLEN